MKKLTLGAVLLAGLAALLWWGNGQRNGGIADPQHPLAFVPADTPYLFGNLQPLPNEVVEQMLEQSAQGIALYADMMAQMRTELSQSDQPHSRRMLAVFDALSSEFAGKTPLQINQTLGFGLDGRMALYGLGVIPVLRIEMADPDKLRGLIGRVEQAAGEALPLAKVGEQSYWKFSADDAPVAAIAAIIERQLVITVAPKAADDALIKQLLGLQRPARTMLQDNALTALNKQYDFLPYFSGYVDSRQLLKTLTGEPDPVATAFADALSIERPSLDASCLQEYQALAASWPRLVVGYNHWDRKRNESRMVLETRSDIAAELQKLRAPMPAVSAAAKTLLHVGLSFKLAALPEVVNAFAGKVAAAPWQCEQLSALNAGFAEARTGINNPALFAAAPVFSGFHLLIDEFALDLSQPEPIPTLSASLILGSDNPQSLIGMAKGLAPPLANLDLPVDGSVVSLPAMPGVPAEMQLYAAAGDKLIGLAIGESASKQLPNQMSVDAEQQPLLLVGLSGRFYSTLADLMLQAAEKDDSESAEGRELLRKQAEMMRTVYSSMLSRVESRVEFTAQGIEIQQRVDMP